MLIKQQIGKVSHPGKIRREKMEKDSRIEENRGIEHPPSVHSMIGRGRTNSAYSGEQSPVFFSRIPIQAKLSIGQPNDKYEQEADSIAEQVMRMPEPQLQRDCACGGGCPVCQAKSNLDNLQYNETSVGEGNTPLFIRNVLKSGGAPLDYTSRNFFEPRFNADLNRVRIFTGSAAEQSARSMNARAYTFGGNIVFAKGEYKPYSETGKALIAHELVHVRQSGGRIYRRISPEDVSGEMVGQMMTVTNNFNTGTFTVNAGDTVVILSWSNTAVTAHVQLPIPYVNALIPFDIPKTHLRPAHGTSTLHRYSSGISSTVSAIQRGEARIVAERARRGGPRPGEIPRLERLQHNRERLLNRRLIQETMYNRFDTSIENWVNYYNTQYSARRFGNLDANLVKAMLFQESELGTSGQFMSVSPPNREMGIHNLGQVIDSSASALLIMMREMEPALITTYHLEHITRDTAHRPAGTNAEEFMWAYVAPGETQGFQDAVNDFYHTASGMRDTSYDFWIRTAVRWLFEKRGHVSSWAEAIRAYNGSGARARHYRDAITHRSRGAAAASRSGTEYVPTR